MVYKRILPLDICVKSLLENDYYYFFKKVEHAIFRTSHASKTGESLIIFNTCTYFSRL